MNCNEFQLVALGANTQVKEACKISENIMERNDTVESAYELNKSRELSRI